MNLDQSGRICLGEFKVFAFDENHRAFWEPVAENMRAILVEDALCSPTKFYSFFEAACASLQEAKIQNVGISNRQCTWEVFVHGLNLLTDNFSGQDMVRLLNRFDTHGNGVIDLGRFLRALERGTYRPFIGQEAFIDGTLRIGTSLTASRP